METIPILSEEKTPRKTIKVIFEFSVLRPKITLYRGVQAADGSFRMEKRGPMAKKFKAFMWCGSVEPLYRYQEIFQAKPRVSIA